MTMNQLIKKLQKIEKQYGKRTKVTMDIKANQTYIQDYRYWEIMDVDVERIPWAINDSYVLADGSERMKTVVTVK